MSEFSDFLQELSINGNIQFRLTGEDGTAIYTSNNFVGNSNTIYVPIYLNKSKVVINIDKKFEVCTGVLKYTIESKYSKLNSERENTVINILENKSITDEKIEKSIKFISKGCSLFIINVDENIHEALNVIKHVYDDEDVVSLIFKNNILVIGSFEDAVEHANGLKEAITTNAFCKCYICSSNIIYDKTGIRKAYMEGIESIELGINYNVNEDVLQYDKLLFEKVVYHMNDELKQELLNKFEQKFNAFDSEMITTIEEFVDSGLNISDAARKIYIHRNTLIYRLDKIKKETGFDIRNFKEATVFIISFLVWKDKTKIK
jgi:DNA-binding PucR family transcriptional regulator